MPNDTEEQLAEAALLREEMDLPFVRGTLDELFLLARHYRKSGQFLELLRFVASFHRYSAFNAMLVHIQMPGAKYVLPAKRWIEEYGRVPKADAQPLVMLQPMTPIMFGFDVSQTEGRALPPGLENPFQVHGQINDTEFEMTVANAQRDGVNVQLKPLGSTMGGYVRDALHPSHRVSIRIQSNSHRTITVDGERRRLNAVITLNANLSHETNYATLTHELGHLYCGHLGTPNSRWWPDRRDLARNVEEFEAESVSYLVCLRAGIDTPAAKYLQSYLDSHEEVPKISLEVVFKAAQRVEAMRKHKMKARKSEGKEI